MDLDLKGRECLKEEKEGKQTLALKEVSKTWIEESLGPLDF